MFTDAPALLVVLPSFHPANVKPLRVGAAGSVMAALYETVPLAGTALVPPLSWYENE